MEKVSFTYYRTPYGVGAVVFNERGVVMLVLPTTTRKAEKEVRKCYSDAFYEKSGKKLFRKRLEAYFSGRKTGFGFPLDLEGFSEFEKNVYSVVKGIDYGTTRSYSWVADRIGSKGCRAVGKALGKNPVPIIIPCHRVIRKNGKLGGFSAGIKWKRKLLELEQIKD